MWLAGPKGTASAEVVTVRFGQSLPLAHGPVTDGAAWSGRLITPAIGTSLLSGLSAPVA